MVARRIDEAFVSAYDTAFTEAVALKYRDIHQNSCHHWDFTFLLWHRKFLNTFWAEIGLDRGYAVLTNPEDRALYASLQKTILDDGQGGFAFVRDPNKLDSLTDQDLAQIELDIAEAMASTDFAIDLDFRGANRDRGQFYNLSFSSQVEQFHDMVHGETGRGMRSVVTAGGDQCFYLHHTFVDLVFETWLQDHPQVGLPIDEAFFDASSELQADYESFAELEELWTQRHYTEGDYKHVRRITAPLVRQAVAFDEIQHDNGYRRIIMVHPSHGEIGRFAVFTGFVSSCAGCARKRAHAGQFLIRHLVPVHEIYWNINNRWYLDPNEAVQALADVGMSRPYVVSF